MAAKQAKDPSTAHAIPEDIAALSYEQAVEEFEEIIDRIESGQVGLEDSLKAYERGIQLRDHCRRILATTEQRIKELSPEDGPDSR